MIYHLAAGRGEKSFPDAFMNSVVTTRNLLEAALASKCLRRFVNISSFTVYNNRQRHGGRLDETCPVETDSVLRGEAYCFGKVKQDELVFDYGKKFNMPYVIVRPGYVIGPEKLPLQAVLESTPLEFFCTWVVPMKFLLPTYENCADAIVLAGLKAGVDGEIFNVVDDDLPSSRRFLRLYKRKVRRFKSVYVPHLASYALLFGMGVVLAMVGKPIAPGVQPWKMVCQLETNQLQQPEIESPTGLVAESFHEGCDESLLRSLS